MKIMHRLAMTASHERSETIYSIGTPCGAPVGWDFGQMVWPMTISGRGSAPGVEQAPRDGLALWEYDTYSGWSLVRFAAKPTTGVWASIDISLCQPVLTQGATHIYTATKGLLSYGIVNINADVAQWGDVSTTAHEAVGVVSGPGCGLGANSMVTVSPVALQPGYRQTKVGGGIRYYRGWVCCNGNIPDYSYLNHSFSQVDDNDPDFNLYAFRQTTPGRAMTLIAPGTSTAYVIAEAPTYMYGTAKWTRLYANTLLSPPRLRESWEIASSLAESSGWSGSMLYGTAVASRAETGSDVVYLIAGSDLIDASAAIPAHPLVSGVVESAVMHGASRSGGCYGGYSMDSPRDTVSCTSESLVALVEYQTTAGTFLAPVRITSTSTSNISVDPLLADKWGNPANIHALGSPVFVVQGADGEYTVFAVHSGAVSQQTFSVL